MKTEHIDVLAPEQTTCDNCVRASDCLFHLPDRYGFKAPGHRAENVGFALVTDRAELHGAMKSFISCVGFVEALQDRMEFGASQRRRGMDGEIVVLMGREGDVIEQEFEVGFNSRGEIVRPHPNLVEPMKAAGHKVNQDDLTAAIQWRKIRIKRSIPPLQSNPKGGTLYTAQVIAEALAHEKHGFVEAEETAQSEAAEATQDRPRRGRPPKHPTEITLPT